MCNYFWSKSCMFISDNLLVFERKKYYHLDSYLNRKKKSWVWLVGIMCLQFCLKIFVFCSIQSFSSSCVCVSICIWVWLRVWVCVHSRKRARCVCVFVVEVEGNLKLVVYFFFEFFIANIIMLWIAHYTQYTLLGTTNIAAHQNAFTENLQNLHLLCPSFWIFLFLEISRKHRVMPLQAKGILLNKIYSLWTCQKLSFQWLYFKLEST